jgi:hypothetical protein
MLDVVCGNYNRQQRFLHGVSLAAVCLTALVRFGATSGILPMNLAKTLAMAIAQILTQILTRSKKSIQSLWSKMCGAQR